MMKRVWVGSFVVVSILLVAWAARADQQTVREKYRVVQVDRFEVAEGVSFPAEYLPALQEDIIRRLQKSKTFDEVLRPGESPAKASAAVLRLSGTITGFKPGSRAKRYIGFGMGKTEIFARLTYSDCATGQTLIVEQVHGVLTGGFAGGKSSNVTREFAKTVARNSKVVLGKRLPAPGEAVAAPPAANVPAGNRERQALAFSSKDFEGTEKNLNEQAARGFRLVAFTLTGKDSATLTLEKTEAGGQAAEYRIIHALRAGTLQKNLNNAASEGFRLTPHTLGPFGSTTAVIAEKTSPGGPSGYQYRVHLTIRISSLQNDIKKDQAEGYRLADTWESTPARYLAILEKSGE